LEAIIFTLGKGFRFRVLFFIDSWDLDRDFGISLGLVGLHEDAVATHNLVLVDIFWYLLNPLLWSELEGEGSNQNS